MSDQAVAENPGRPVDCLGEAEIGPAIDSLDAGDKLKLQLIAEHFARGTGMSPRDLVHEAIYRSLDGRRRCPRETPVMAFLVQTMRGIAYHARGKQNRIAQLTGEPDHPSPALALSAPVLPATINPEVAILAQEAEAEARQMVERIHLRFEGDEKALLMLMGWAEGLHGKDLRELVGVDQAELDYLAKKIRREMKKIYPEGRRP